MATRSAIKYVISKQIKCYDLSLKNLRGQEGMMVVQICYVLIT